MNADNDDSFRFGQFCKLRFVFTWFDKPLSMKSTSYQEHKEDYSKFNLQVDSHSIILNDLTLHRNDDSVYFCVFSFWLILELEIPNIKVILGTYLGLFCICTCFCAYSHSSLIVRTKCIFWMRIDFLHR